MSEENWKAPPAGTLTIRGEDVARTSTGELVFMRDPFKIRAPQRQPKAPRPAAKDFPATGRVEEDASPWWLSY